MQAYELSAAIPAVQLIGSRCKHDSVLKSLRFQNATGWGVLRRRTGRMAEESKVRQRPKHSECFKTFSTDTSLLGETPKKG
jgi:hypothetical protein